MASRERIPALFLTATLALGGCNTQEHLANNPNGGLNGSPHDGTVATQEPTDPAYSCGSLEEYELVGPATGGQGGMDDDPGNQGNGNNDGSGDGNEDGNDGGNGDYGSAQSGAYMVARNLGRCTVVLGVDFDSPVDINKGDEFTIICTYKNPVENKPLQFGIVPGADPYDPVAQTNAGYIELSPPIVNSITEDRPSWLLKCPAPKANIPKIFPHTYPDNGGRPADKPNPIPTS